MKSKVFCILLLSLYMLAGDKPVMKTAEVKALTPARVQILQPVAQNDLRIVGSLTRVNRGSAGFITIQGEPGEKYSVRTSFMIGNELRSVIQWRKAGPNGEATFSWVVSPETVPGTYDVIISGDGKTVMTTHTVLP